MAKNRAALLREKQQQQQAEQEGKQWEAAAQIPAPVEPTGVIVPSKEDTDVIMTSNEAKIPKKRGRKPKASVVVAEVEPERLSEEPVEIVKAEDEKTGEDAGDEEEMDGQMKRTRKVIEKFLQQHPGVVDIDAQHECGETMQIVLGHYRDMLNKIVPERVLEASEKSISCPFPKCPKSFTTLPGIVAHCQTATHIVWDLLQDAGLLDRQQCTTLKRAYLSSDECETKTGFCSRLKVTFNGASRQVVLWAMLKNLKAAAGAPDSPVLLKRKRPGSMKIAGASEEDDGPSASSSPAKKGKKKVKDEADGEASNGEETADDLDETDDVDPQKHRRKVPIIAERNGGQYMWPPFQHDLKFAEWRPALPTKPQIRPVESVIPFYPENSPLISFPERVGGNTIAVSKGLQIPLFSPHFAPIFNNAVAIINTGGRVNSVSWCPDGSIFSESATATGRQYVAVGNSQTPLAQHLIGKTHTGKNCIQIWSVNPDEKNLEPKLEFGILHNNAYATQLSWCPRGAQDKETVPPAQANSAPRLGLLSAVLGDGSVCIYSVPFPDFVRSAHKLKESTQLFVELEPVFRGVIENHPIISSDWSVARISMLATGCSTGMVALWDLRTPLKTTPLQMIHLYDNPVKQLSWSPKSEFLLSSTSYDGEIAVVDIRDPHATVHRRKGVAQTLTWSPNVNGIFTNDLVNARHGGVHINIEEEERAVTARAFVYQRPMSIGWSYWSNLIVSGGQDGRVIVTEMNYSVLRKRKRSPLERGGKPIFSLWPMTALPEDPFTPVNHVRFREHDLLGSSDPVLEFDEKTLDDKEDPSLKRGNLFPSELGITQAVWNPNKSCSQWCAFGTSLGFLRIQKIHIQE